MSAATPPPPPPGRRVPASATPRAKPPAARSGRPRAGLNRRSACWTAHLTAGLGCGLALLFTAWFARTNPALIRLLQYLTEEWHFGSGFEWRMLGWTAAALFLFVVLGRFLLECFELYLPRPATLALSFLFGMGLAGFVLELLAIPHWLYRAPMAAALGGLLGLLWLGAIWRGRRRPASGLGGEPGYNETLLRRALARAAWRAAVTRPRGAAWLLAVPLVALIVAIQFFIFWHAVLYPEVYWDSLILYLGYARMTFLEHGFHTKVTGQVGFGLGANYPHLFPVLGAGIATAAGQWSELPQRIIAPLCGTATTLLVYHTGLRLTRHVIFSLILTLLYRAVPLGIIYDQYASDYALALLFAAAFLYLCLLYLQTALPGYLAAAAILTALAMHLNYLMGILWLPWVITLWGAHAGAPRPDPRRNPELEGAPWTALPARPPLARALRRGWLWGILLLSCVIGSTWYIRNWIVTGNPVYAFFHEWLGGKHINPEVMEAAAHEWRANGAGIGRLGDSPMERLRAAFTFFAGPGPGFFWHQYYRTEPLLLGFTLFGVLAWLGRWISGCLSGRSRRRRRAHRVLALRFGWVVASLLFGLLAFHFVLAPFYLYQIIMILPCAALMVAFAWPWWRLPLWRTVLLLLALWVGVIPGLAMAMMGFKIVGMFQLSADRTESPLTLYPLRHPLPRPEVFYRWRFGEDARMWDYINRNLKGERLLTHDNRHLVYDPSITLVHLDDWTDEWNIQALWGLPNPADRVRQLIQLHNIRYYLFIPNELAAATNRRMQTEQWVELHLAELIFQAGENRLYRLRLPPEDQPLAAPTTPFAAGAPAPAADQPTTATP